MAVFIEPPRRPKDVVAVRNSDSQATITWVTDSGVQRPYDSQRISRWDSLSNAWNDETILTGTDTSRNSPLGAGIRYIWRLRARNTAGWSEFTTSNPVQTTPNAPTAPSLNQASPGQVTVGWSNGIPGTGYEYTTEIWGSLNNGAYALAAVVGAGVTSHTFTGLTAGQNWKYQIRHKSTVSGTLYSGFITTTSRTLYAAQATPSWFTKGRITLQQAPLLRSMAHTKIVPDFRGYREPGVMPNGQFPSSAVDKALERKQALLPLNFAGSRIKFLAIQPVTALFKGPRFPWFPNGRLLMGGLDFGATGALTDFAFFSTTSSDPMTGLLEEAATSLNSGTVDNDWTRHYAVVIPPEKARYMAMGGLFTAQSQGLSQSLYAAQAEILPVGTTTPSAYSDPREVRVIIRAERMNWSKNPAFLVNTNGWTNVTRTAVALAPSGWAGRNTVVAGANELVEHTVSGLARDRTYLVKARMVATPGVIVRPSVSGGAVAIVGAGEDTEIGPHGGDVVMLIRTNSTDDTVLTFQLRPGVNATVDVYSLLIEDTEDTTREYFDGNTPGDYFWESGQTAGSSRSYYYKNFLPRYKTVSGILESDAPMGVGVAEPQYGVPPTD